MHVSPIRASCEQGVHRVAADVDGAPLWYESSDIDLLRSPEAFGTAFLLPALHRKRRLILDDPVGAVWLSNIEQLLAVWHRWWQYPTLLPHAPIRAATASPSSRKTALCFSGGVDSFYTLVHNAEKPDFLVTLHGFDFPLRDDVRMAAVEATLRTVAEAFGATPIVIRTNFREHPAAGRASLWVRSHGAVLASAGHLLSHVIDRLTISSSVYRDHNAQPWGSSFETDRLWSSDQLSVSCYGADAHRDEKVRYLADDPLVQERLRVCCENRTPSGNCSRCAKCLMVMLILAECGTLDRFRVFDDQEVLAGRINRLPYLRDFMGVVERSLERGRLTPDLARAARRLLTRSRPVEKIRARVERLRSAFF